MSNELPKIYTKTGDKGKTGLVDGSRVSKSDPRVDALGTLDEANAALGLIITQLSPQDTSRELLLKAQSLLFTCGSRIAEPTEVSSLGLSMPDAKILKEYEKSIDAMTKELPELTQFILPGGTELAARTHMARAVVRRAERCVVELKEADAHIDSEIVQFLNRLSDWLFTLARYYNHQAGQTETIWQAN